MTTTVVSPGLAFADPAFHLGLFVVELVVGVVSPPGCRCYHGSGLASGVVGGIFCKAPQTEKQTGGLEGEIGGSKKKNRENRGTDMCLNCVDFIVCQ